MWWRQAVFYEIYIRSFQDSNGDGIGDLNGIIDRLDYLADLGVDAIWITPFYPSPRVDFGYDVSDFEQIDPLFGTLGDFDHLIAAAHARGIRVIVDLVLNHTSNEHAWFLASRSSRDSPYRDWYIWRDGRGPGLPPNNWESAFGGPAWTFDERSGQWYYHCFYPEQPDLNWRNPAVEERMFATVAFWLDRGVDGFRLDAVNALFEDPELRDNPVLPEPELTLTGVRSQRALYTHRLPEMHGVLRRLRTFVERRAPSVVLISEAYVEQPEELVRFYGEADDEVHLPFNFFLAQVAALDAGAFRRTVESVFDACGPRWPSLVLSNHDIERACDRYATELAEVDGVAKMLAALLLTLRGSPFLYYGEEIAFRTAPPGTLNEVRDPVGRRFWPRYRGRDGERRPMPWSEGPGAGFTTGLPWLGLPPDAARRNVAAQLGEPESVLNFYRALVRLRRQRKSLSSGEYRALDGGRDIFSFLRQSDSDAVAIVLNMSRETRPLAVDPEEPSAARRWRVALGTHRREGVSLDLRDARLEGYEALVLEPGRESHP